VLTRIYQRGGRPWTYTARVPWLFLISSALGLALTANAFWPVRRYRPPLAASFFASWLVSEAPLHHLAAQALLACAFVAAGALHEPAGWLALALTLSSCAGLFEHYRIAQRAQHIVEDALAGALGADYRARLQSTLDLDGSIPRGRLTVPVWLTDGNVRVIKHIPYASGGRRRMLNLYLPKGDISRAPVLFQIHGGAWTIGHKAQQARPLLHYMAARGWVCVSINYRLSPRAKWPAHLIDAKLALAWVKQHIAEYGGDPDFIISTGGSAGGHLTAMIALTPNDARFQPDVPDVDTRVQAAIPIYAPYDFCDRERTQPHSGLRMMLEHVVVGKRLADAPELYESGSPMAHVHADAPPFFMLHGANDTVACVEDARAFARRLKAVSKAPVAFAELPYTQHAFEVFHSPRVLHVIRAIHRFAETIYAQHRARQQTSTSYVRELAGTTPQVSDEAQAS
jgi:acetyl esterase/lipase